jgi:hypothetical protein
MILIEPPWESALRFVRDILTRLIESRDVTMYEVGAGWAVPAEPPETCADDVMRLGAAMVVAVGMGIPTAMGAVTAVTVLVASSFFLASAARTFMNARFAIVTFAQVGGVVEVGKVVGVAVRMRDEVDEVVFGGRK